MPITENDIKLLASQRMADTPDGGGRMTGTVVQSGMDNNIFDDVSNLDRVYGNVSLRKVFAAVLTDDTDKYLGARVIIDKPPADPNVHALLFDASSTFDTRADVSVKVESYLAQGVVYLGVLFGDHLAGQSVLMVQRNPTRGPPGIGEVLVLQKLEGLAGEVTQFVRITEASGVEAEFTDAEGKPYKLLLCTCSISDPLRAAFPGWEPTKGGFVPKRSLEGPGNSGRTLVYESVVADASQYFGIRPLAQAVSMGAYNIKADSAYSPLLPSAQIEAPIADARTNGQASALASAGAPITQTLTAAWSPAQSLYVGGAILPGTLAVVRGGVTVADANGVLTSAGADVGVVDYANGVLTLATDVWGSAGTYTVTYTPAAEFVGITKSVGIPVGIANRSLSYVLTLSPLPARGSLSASYLAGGRWYTLRDGGTGALSGGDPSLGVGSLNLTTGTLVLTLGALPDVGGAVVLQWCEAAPVVDNTNTVLRMGGKAWVPINTSGHLSTEAGEPIAPGTLTLTWDNGGTKTATDDGNGALIGDATGVVDYQQGVVYFAPNSLPPKDTVVSLVQQVYAAATAGYAVNALSSTSATVALPPGAAPNSVSFSLRLRPVGTPADVALPDGVSAEPWNNLGASVAMAAKDNGSGAVVANGMIVGTINYATGLMSLDVTGLAGAGTVLMSRWGYEHGQVGVDPVGNPINGYVFSETQYQDAPVTSYTLDISAGPLPVTISTAPAAQPRSAMLSSLLLQVDNLAAAYTLTGVSFTLAGLQYHGQPNGTLVHTVNPATGSGTPAGTVLGAQGLVRINNWAAGHSTVGAWRGVQAPPADGDDNLGRDTSILFRTVLPNIRPSSLQITGTMADGTAINVTANGNGHINGTRIKGLVNHEAGLVELYFVNPAATELGTVDLTRLGIAGVGVVNVDVVRPASLRYNAVSYSYLPLDASILGLDPVRLPQDGRVPVFKAGRVVVVHNTQLMAPATVSDGQTLNTSRTRLARVRVLGADGEPITAGWTSDLDAGTVTFTAVTGYSQPVTVEHRIEDEALCAEAQITGDLRLTRPLTHDYPVPGTYVSSALIVGTKQAASTEGFSQAAWAAVWADSPIGSPITAQYNQALHPIAVTNKGAIEQRWALIFTNSTTFRVVGESVGEILLANTAEVCAPVNIATGVPYFSLAPGGWGTGWAAGNVLRFNTRSANHPVWVSRTVLQSPAAPPGTDQIVISVRGDIDV